MSVIDRKRIAAVRLLEKQGHQFEGDRWVAPDGIEFDAIDGDAMLALLSNRADQLMGCAEDSTEAHELRGHHCGHRGL